MINKNFAYLFLVALWAACSSSSEQAPPLSDSSMIDYSVIPPGSDSEAPDQAIDPDASVQADAIVAADMTGGVDLTGIPDYAGLPQFVDDCPPAAAPITEDMELSGRTNAQNIFGSNCASPNGYVQVVPILIWKKQDINLTVTCDSSLTNIMIRSVCKSGTGSCKGGDAKNGLTYSVTKEAGYYYIVVGTNNPASFTLKVKINDPS